MENMSEKIIQFKYGNETADLYIDEQKIKTKNYTISKFSKIKHKSRAYLIFSEECNINCIYCFQKNKHKTTNIKNMEYDYDEIFSKLNSFDQSVLFGGEPLLEKNFNIINKALNSLQNDIVIFTNGNFEDYWYDLILNAKSKIKNIIITVDGDEETHNSRRINNYNNSFRMAIDNIIKLYSEGINVTVQINVDRKNISKINSVIKLLKDKNVNIVINPVKYTTDSLDFEALLENFLNLKLMYHNLNLDLNNRTYQNLKTLLFFNAYNDKRCRLDKQIVVNFESGMIYACPQNDKTEIGNVMKNEITYNINNIEELVNTINFNSEHCLDCRLSFLCSYGCPNDLPNYKECYNDMLKLIKFILNNYKSFFVRRIFFE